ncbi:MAG: hypothetical protein ACK506_24045 [Pirellula sp.]|jgi:hypothetical protein
MKSPSFSTMALVIALVLNFFGSFCFAQKNGNDRRDEQRENERVRNAEREVSQARKRISEIQNDLKSQLRRFDSAQDKVSKCKATVREAREAAESELGVKLGIPESLAAVREKRQIYDELDEASDRLQELRKKLTPDTVNSHRLVVAASKTLAEVEKQFLSIDREIANTRGAIAKTQRVLQQTISELAKAKQADTSDNKKRGKKLVG